MSIVFDFKDIRSRIKGDPWIKRKPVMKCEAECPGDDTCENAKYCMCGIKIIEHQIVSDGHTPISIDKYSKLHMDDPDDPPF